MPPAGRVSDISDAPIDAHGCPACPHPSKGPAVQGSPNVFINGLMAVRLGDKGVHTACCGPNIWTAVMGSATVFINHMPAHRKGDLDAHCGGIGTLSTGSPTVNIGG